MKRFAQPLVAALVLGICLLAAPSTASAGMITGPTWVDTPTGVIVTYTGGPVTELIDLLMIPPEVSPITGIWSTGPIGLVAVEVDAGVFDLVLTVGSLERLAPPAGPFFFALLVSTLAPPGSLTDMSAAVLDGVPFTATLTATTGPTPTEIASWELVLTAGTPSSVIPEPSSIALLGLGVCGLAGFGFYRRKAR